jgi:hypothetical protein
MCSLSTKGAKEFIQVSRCASANKTDEKDKEGCYFHNNRDMGIRDMVI